MDYPRGQIKRNRKTFTGSETEDRELLKALAVNGVVSRYGKHNDEAIKKWRRNFRLFLKWVFVVTF